MAARKKTTRQSRRGRVRPQTRREKLELDVHLTDGELLTYGERAGALRAEANDKREALQAHNKAAKAEIQEIERELGEALRKVREKKEAREVDCEITMDFAENAVKTVRLDTGELVHERAMTFDERQGQMFDLDSVVSEAEADSPEED